MANKVLAERKMLVILAAALLIFGGMLMAWNCAKEKPAQGGSTAGTALTGNVQEIYLKALGSGTYDKQTLTVRKGLPVRLHFSAEPTAGCGKALLIKKFGVQLVSKNGEEQVATFTPQETGTFEYSCSMRMFVGKMTVVP